MQLTKLMPARAKYLGPSEIGRLSQKLTSRRPESPLEEVQQQNQELVQALEALRGRQDEIERVNRELEDTNRGVVALYAELDERADHLRRADELKTKFLSNMTHEFRTPVNSILALARLLSERLDLNDSDKNELYYIRKSAQQLSDLVDDLLDIAKVDAGKVKDKAEITFSGYQTLPGDRGVIFVELVLSKREVRADRVVDVAIERVSDCGCRGGLVMADAWLLCGRPARSEREDRQACGESQSPRSIRLG